MVTPNRLCLYEQRDAAGGVHPTWLLEDGGALALESPDTARALPLSPAALEAVFRRYARPLGVAAPPVQPDDQRIDVTLPSGRAAMVRAFSFRGWGSVLPEDYVLLAVDGEEPLAAPAPLVSAALAALARAADAAARAR